MTSGYLGKKLLSGNEAIALGAYHAGARVVTAYPGTPSTEILESMAHFKDIYVEWSTNEKVAMEVALGACYSGVRSMVSMKQVGLNVASDPFMAASMTGVSGGLVVVCTDDPGIHSSQNEQDNRHYAKFARVPMLEPSDSQEGYEFLSDAFNISEEFDTPVMVRSTTRISHSKSVVEINRKQLLATGQPLAFGYDFQKYVMLPVNARFRHPLLEERLIKLGAYAETTLLNQIQWGDRRLGIVTSGVAYQYAREAFPEASILKLGMTYPLSENLLRDFVTQVGQLIVIEELDPFLQEHIRSMGIKVTGKEFIPLVGELNTRIVEERSQSAGLVVGTPLRHNVEIVPELPKRPPLLCPGCPHSGIFFILNTIGQRSKFKETNGSAGMNSKLVITGDIGCYTLAAYPPLLAMDSCACMGASIGMALGMEKAGIESKIVAVIGDSTFMHSGITGLVNAVYNQGKIMVIVLDNGTTAMTGHQHHPGTGVTAQGKKTNAIQLEQLIRGVGINDVKVIDAFDIKAIRSGVRSSLDSQELSVIVVRGACSLQVPRNNNPRVVNTECNKCNVCLLIGCPAIQCGDEQVFIDTSLCAGDTCTICQQLCPQHAIESQLKKTVGESK
ncbi:indolepyruvate ferredoxin oxidoreductase subunit alpha [Chloroflexota bacterium]